MASIGKAQLIGSKARELMADLTPAPFPYKEGEFNPPSPVRRGVGGEVGRVLAVVTDAAYVETGDEILWLVQEHLPMHARAIRGSFDLSALRAGMSFGRDDIDLASASVWQPITILHGQVAQREIIIARARQLVAEIQSLDCGDSLGRVIPLTGAIADGNDAMEIESSIPTIKIALGPIRDIAHACRDRNIARALEAGRALVGLGPGLTPSGDDFLGGLLFMAHHLHATFPGLIQLEQAQIADLLEWARPRTNPISHTILFDHAQGQSVEPLHDLVAALLQGKEQSETTRCARQLARIGSTSGCDMLAGALTGLLLIEF